MYADDLALFLNNLNCALDLAKLIFLFQGLDKRKVLGRGCQESYQRHSEV